MKKTLIIVVSFILFISNCKALDNNSMMINESSNGFYNNNDYYNQNPTYKDSLAVFLNLKNGVDYNYDFSLYNEINFVDTSYNKNICSYLGALNSINLNISYPDILNAKQLLIFKKIYPEEIIKYNNEELDNLIRLNESKINTYLQIKDLPDIIYTKENSSNQLLIENASLYSYNYSPSGSININDNYINISFPKGDNFLDISTNGINENNCKLYSDGNNVLMTYENNDFDVKRINFKVGYFKLTISVNDNTDNICFDVLSNDNKIAEVCNNNSIYLESNDYKIVQNNYFDKYNAKYSKNISINNDTNLHINFLLDNVTNYIENVVKDTIIEEKIEKNVKYNYNINTDMDNHLQMDLGSIEGKESINQYENNGEIKDVSTFFSLIVGTLYAIFKKNI